MRAELLLALLLAAPALRAGDLGSEVTFGARHGARFKVHAATGPRVVFDSGLSDPPAGAWDTLLIQGEMPDPGLRFSAARPAGPAGWIELSVKRFPDGRFWAKGRFPKGAGALRLRALADGVRADHEVIVYAAEVFEDGPGSEAAAPPPSRGPMDPEAQAPPTHARAEWRALPPRHPFTPDPLPWRVTLHHTDGRYTSSLSESLDETRFIQDFHQNGRKWTDIAYHFVVDPLGNIIEARPLETLGAHTLNNNEGNVGIVILGKYHAPRNDMPTAPQLASVAALGRFLVKRFGIDPASLKGHRDYKKTDCPGDMAYPRLPELRRAFDPVPPPAISSSPGWDAQRARNSAASPSPTR
ncbi:MAG: peptidoglycan recognition protein family protein [Elusimicrobia bacterium]|nr:peptidoglycan recognition protein family protein [Elusimicrobiota bacterium]